MSLFQNLGIIYYLIPFIGAVDNKFGLLFSILIGSKNYKVKATRWEQESIAKLQNKIIQIPVCVLKDMCEFLSDRDRSVVSQVCK